MKYIFKFIKYVSISGWILYLVKLMFEDFVEFQLLYCMYVVFFTMVLYLISVIELWYLGR
jgi:hypothetical protein